MMSPSEINVFHFAVTMNFNFLHALRLWDESSSTYLNVETDGKENTIQKIKKLMGERLMTLPQASAWLYEKRVLSNSLMKTSAMREPWGELMSMQPSSGVLAQVRRLADVE